MGGAPPPPPTQPRSRAMTTYPGVQFWVAPHGPGLAAHVSMRPPPPPSIVAAARVVRKRCLVVGFREFAAAMRTCPRARLFGRRCLVGFGRAAVARVDAKVRSAGPGYDWWDAIVREARQDVIGVPEGHNFATDITKEKVERALRRPGSAGGRKIVDWFEYLDARPDDPSWSFRETLFALWDSLSWFNADPDGGADVGAVVSCALHPAGCVSPAFLSGDGRATAFMRWLLRHRELFEASAAASRATDVDLDEFVWSSSPPVQNPQTQ